MTTDPTPPSRATGEPSEPALLDRIHGLLEGRLAPHEIATLERELAADPALRALAVEYRLVHALTTPAAELPASRLCFEDLEPWLAPEPRLLRPGRRAAAAAALLLVLGAALVLALRARSGGRELLLHAIALETAAPAPPVELPTISAEFDPRGESGVRFLSDVDAAARLARAAERPLLVYGSFPGCPMCAALDARVFADPSVVELAERTVPVRIDLSQLPEAEMRALVARGYPFLEVWRQDKTSAHSLSRLPEPRAFVESLHDGLAESDATGEQPAWELVRSLVRRLLQASASEREGRLAEAERGFRELAFDPRGTRFFAQAAAAGLSRLQDGARSALLEARAATDPAGARRVLEQALERYSGTPFEADLRAVLERLERDGRFPDLVGRERSA